MNGLGAAGQCYGINGSLTAIGAGGVWYNATTPGAHAGLAVQFLGGAQPRQQLAVAESTCEASTTPARLPDIGTNTAGNSEAFLATPALPGDANLDGRVDINDLTIVLSNFGQTTGMSWATGDFNGDGRVDIERPDDRAVELRPDVAASAVGHVAAVPEPSSLLLIGLGIAALVAGVRRRRVVYTAPGG